MNVQNYMPSAISQPSHLPVSALGPAYEETEDSMAPYSHTMFHTKERYQDIDIGVFDYVLRCINGPYTDKYFHIKTCPNGEVIGGAP